MNTAFYICGICPEDGISDETKADELYDRFSHNELSGHELIVEILKYNDINIEDIDRHCYEPDMHVDTQSYLYEENGIQVYYDPFCGAWDIFKVFES